MSTADATADSYPRLRESLGEDGFKELARLIRTTYEATLITILPVRWCFLIFRMPLLAVWSEAVADSRAEDERDLLRGQRPRRVTRPRAAVVEPGRAFSAIAADPFVARRPADAELDCDHRHGLAQDHNPIDQKLAREHTESGITMSHESLLLVRCVNNPHHADGLSSVNNVFGNHT